MEGLSYRDLMKITAHIRKEYGVNSNKPRKIKNVKASMDTKSGKFDKLILVYSFTNFVKYTTKDKSNHQNFYEYLLEQLKSSSKIQ